MRSFGHGGAPHDSNGDRFQGNPMTPSYGGREGMAKDGLGAYQRGGVGRTLNLKGSAMYATNLDDIDHGGDGIFH